MNKNLDELYEERKKELNFEICFIEGVQYNFKLEDIQNLIGVKTKDDVRVFKKYLYYLDVYRCNFEYIESLDEAIEKFTSVLEEDEVDKEPLKEMFKKHEKLFSGEDGMMKLKLVPSEYDIRIFSK